MYELFGRVARGFLVGESASVVEDTLLWCLFAGDAISELFEIESSIRWNLRLVVVNA